MIPSGIALDSPFTRAVERMSSPSYGLPGTRQEVQVALCKLVWGVAMGQGPSGETKRGSLGSLGSLGFLRFSCFGRWLRGTSPRAAAMGSVESDPALSRAGLDAAATLTAGSSASNFAALVVERGVDVRVRDGPFWVEGRVEPR
jgi:hypothetical protein